jgi:hypothetical protein
MFAILCALEMFVTDLFKSRSRLEAGTLLLRRLTIAMRQAPTRLRLRGSDRVTRLSLFFPNEPATDADLPRAPTGYFSQALLQRTS